MLLQLAFPGGWGDGAVCPIRLTIPFLYIDEGHLEPRNVVGRSTGKLFVKNSDAPVRTLGTLATWCLGATGAQGTDKQKPQL